MKSKILVLLSVGLLAGPIPTVAVELLPGSYVSLGDLNVNSGTLLFDTDSLTVSGAYAGTGVVQAQLNGYPQVAVFTFSAVNIGSGVTVIAQGSRPLAILSQGELTVAAPLSFSGGRGGDGDAYSSACDATSRGSGGVAGVGGGGGGAGGTMDTSCGVFPGGSNFNATAGQAGTGTGAGGGGAAEGGDGGAATFSPGGALSLALGLMGGSGGGGGGGSDVGTDAYGAGGGGGGGAVEFGAVGAVTLNTIAARAGGGGDSSGGGGSGGGGSGGAVFVHGSSVSVVAIDASGTVPNGGGSVRIAPAVYSLGDGLPTVVAGLGELAPDLTKVPTGETLTLTAGGALMPGGLTLFTHDVAVEGGELTGSGHIAGNLFNAGTVAAGTSAGHIDITGDFTQTAAGSLLVELGGTSRTAPAQYDSFDANMVVLDGGLYVNLVSLISGGPLFAPSLGDYFDIFLANEIRGDFSSFLLPTFASGLAFDHLIAVVDGGRFAYRLIVVEGNSSTVPEPGSLALLGLGFAGLGLIRRRKA